MIANSSHALSVMSARSPTLPPSFDNSAFLYAYALFSICVLALLNWSVFAIMARDIYRDRRVVHPLTTLTAFRVMMLFVGMTGGVRATPEIAYMMMWNEAPANWLSAILFVKRTFDAFAFFPGIMWTGVLVLAYPHIVVSLRRFSGATDLTSMVFKLWKPAVLVVLIFMLALLMAIGKVLMGVAVA